MVGQNGQGTCYSNDTMALVIAGLNQFCYSAIGSLKIDFNNVVWFELNSPFRIALG